MTTKPKIILLYVGYMECLENWSKVGITGESFEARWRAHNNAFPASARMRKSSSGEFWLHEEDARVIEKQAKARWSNTAEWINRPHEDLETIIEGLIARARFRFWRRKPKKLAAEASSASPTEKSKSSPRPQAAPDGLTPPKKEPGELRKDYDRRLRRWRVDNGLCYTCGKAKIDPSLKTRCLPCNEKHAARHKRWRKAKNASASCLLLVGFAGAQHAEACEEAELIREAAGAVTEVADGRRHDTQPAKPPAWLA